MGEQWSLLRDFSDSKRTKTVVVCFIISISSIMFFAFVEPLVDATSCYVRAYDEACFSKQRARVENILCTLFFTRYVLLCGAFEDIIRPWFALRLRKTREQNAYGRMLSFTERQMNMPTYGGDNLTTDYLNIFLPVGFLLFFGALLP